ncbi:MAG: hypothetical protein FJ104_09300, partial [Deltaproteobacteria bacterium]|nr:hypothetical protein [Deltaproteobacteria bacterium]
MLQVDESGEPLSDPSGSEPEGEVGDESIGVAQGELKSPTLLEASGNTVLAVTANGNVVRWGRTGATTSRANPEPTGMSGVTSVSVAVDGSWRLVGSTASGSVLFGGVTQGYTLAPDNVVKVATSPVDSSHTCQLLQTGRVECLAWPGGDGNKYGQVGDGTTIAAGF